MAQKVATHVKVGNAVNSHRNTRYEIQKASLPKWDRLLSENPEVETALESVSKAQRLRYASGEDRVPKELSSLERGDEGLRARYGNEGWIRGLCAYTVLRPTE